MDKPAICEGLPLCKQQQTEYLHADVITIETPRSNGQLITRTAAKYLRKQY